MSNSSFEVDSIFIKGTDMCPIKTYSTTTDGTGTWSIDYTSDNFTSVKFILAQAVYNAGGIDSEKIATIHTYNTTSASGKVIESAAVLSLGNQGLEYCNSGITVNIIVSGNI